MERKIIPAAVQVAEVECLYPQTHPRIPVHYSTTLEQFLSVWQAKVFAVSLFQVAHLQPQLLIAVVLQIMPAI